MGNVNRRIHSLIDRVLRRLPGAVRYRWFLRSWAPSPDLQASRDLLATMRFSQQLQPQQGTLPAAQRLLVIAPHPDDEVIGPGGTLIGTVAAGKDVRVLYLTGGRPDERQARVSEARSVCADAGFTARFLDHASQAIPVPEAADSLAAELSEFRPGAVFVPFLLDDHGDHRLANDILARALQHVGGSGGVEIWAYQVYSVVPGNIVVDISAQAERKSELIRTYRSQNQRRDWAHFALGLNAFNSRFMRTNGEARYGEMYFVVPGDAYVKLCRDYFARLGQSGTRAGRAD